MGKKQNNGVLTGFALLKQIRKGAKYGNTILVKLNEAAQGVQQQVEERGVPISDIARLNIDHIHTAFTKITKQAAYQSGVAIKGAIDTLPKGDFGQLQKTARKSGLAKNR